MAGVSEIADLEARKRELVRQSELCRQSLQADLHNLAQYGANLRRRVDQVRSFGPWLLLAAPLATPLVGLLFKKRGKTANSAAPARTKGIVASALLAYRLYRKYAPLVRSMVGHLVSRRSRTGDRSPAADI
jgi:hypothetical protein